MSQPGITTEAAERLVAQVFALIRACPIGRVTTYSALGKAVGHPRGARMIGWMTQEATADVPARRVVSSKGELTGNWAFDGKMRQLLEDEGITFNDDGTIDLRRYGWEPLRDLSETALRETLDQAPPLVGAFSPRLLYKLQHDPASPFKSA
jgi:methylated-DNA-protein-cysteine methyltransferase-like protein